MTKIGTFYEKRDVKTYTVEEGNLTITRGLSRPHGDPQDFATFASQVDEENFLTRGTSERSLKIATTTATHFNPYDPEVVGMIPKTSTVAGAYNNRIVGAVKLISGEMLLPLAPDNVKIKAGDKLEIKTAKTGLDKYTGSNTTVATAWDDVPANTGGYILCDVNGPIQIKS